MFCPYSMQGVSKKPIQVMFPTVICSELQELHLRVSKNFFAVQKIMNQSSMVASKTFCVGMKGGM